MDDLLDRAFIFPGAEEQKPAPAETAARKATRTWLAAQGQRSLFADFGGVSPAEFEQLRSLLGYPAFGLFWSLLRHQRTEYQERLTGLALNSPEMISAASVLQGHIRCLDQLREMLLDISDPSAQQGEGTANE